MCWSQKHSSSKKWKHYWNAKFFWSQLFIFPTFNVIDFNWKIISNINLFVKILIYVGLVFILLLICWIQLLGAISLLTCLYLLSVLYKNVLQIFHNVRTALFHDPRQGNFQGCCFFFGHKYICWHISSTTKTSYKKAGPVRETLTLISDKTHAVDDRCEFKKMLRRIWIKRFFNQFVSATFFSFRFFFWHFSA